MIISLKHILSKAHRSFFFYGACIYLMALSSCNTTKFLKDDELLLEHVETRIRSNERIEYANDIKSELEEFYKQKPNGKFLFIPREWYWFKNQDPGDTTWIKKWSKNALGEEPSIFDTTILNNTRESMQNYLQNKKGFYNARVNSIIKTNGKLATINYVVDPGKRYTINSIKYIAVDSSLTQIIDSIAKESILHPGDPVDAFTFDIEQQRLVSELQNLGYADFNLNYIDIKGDSSQLSQAIDIFFEILPTNDNSVHKKYKVGDLKIYTDHHQFQLATKLEEEIRFGSKYFRESSKFIVKPSTINRKLFLNKGDIYKAENYSKTIRKLFSLGTYRFVKLTPSISPVSDDIIDYSIYLTPQNNRWIFDLGTDIFFSNISRIDNLVGFAVGTGLQNRNAFGGSEIYKLSFETGVEFKAGSPFETNTFSLGLNNSLEIPQLTKPLNTVPFLNKIGIIKDKSMQTLRDEGKTTISLGYNFLDILDNYKISSINTSYGYDFKLSKKHRLVFNQIGFNLTEYTIRDGFKDELMANPLLERRFQTSLFSGLIFKDLTFYYQSDNLPDRSTWAFISSLELSGLEVYLANKLYNGISNSSDIWRINNNIDFEKHIKFTVDGRWSRRLIKESRLAARLKAGVAAPYGGEDELVSFIKQILVGGPNSIRAWRPMELGPGSYIFESTDPDPIFFQRGDLSLEFSLEYRFNLFWLLEGALFFDGGNVWTLKEDPLRPGAKITSNFTNEIALGYGYGLRWDFSYFIIRFDFGFKLRNPYVTTDQPSHWLPFKGQGLFGNPNIAINYPF